MSETPAPSTSNVSPAWRRALDNPWLMLVMLFFVTAAFGIPFLWLSRGFSTTVKVALTIVVLLYTGLILWAFTVFMIYWWTHFIAPYL